MMRIGVGFDAHRFARNRRLVLGGAVIPYELGLDGHSDADVLVHAVMDAIVGALCIGDKGKLFPDTDMNLKDISSLVLLERIMQIRKFSIVNVDSVVICQEPKLQQYIEEMRKNMAVILKTDAENVSVKATTTEYMGFAGRKEGIAAIATVLLDV